MCCNRVLFSASFDYSCKCRNPFKHDRCGDQHHGGCFRRPKCGCGHNNNWDWDNNNFNNFNEFDNY